MEFFVAALCGALDQVEQALVPPSTKPSLADIHFLNPIQNGTWEDEVPEAEFIHWAVRAGDNVLEIGANIGRSSIVAAHCSQPGGSVVSSEADPERLLLAKANAASLAVRFIPASTESAEYCFASAGWDGRACLWRFDPTVQGRPAPSAPSGEGGEAKAAVVAACAELVVPGGTLYFSTINRNPKAYAFAIVGAEHILRLLPAGTHEYAKFIRPSELAAWLRDANLVLQDMTGLTYNPLTRQYRLNPRDVSVNYMVKAVKPAS